MSCATPYTWARKKSFWIWFIYTPEGHVRVWTIYFFEKVFLWNTLTLRLWHSWECVCAGGVPNFGPGQPKKGQNGPKMAKIWLWVLWWSQMIKMAWNELQDILAEVLAQLGVCLCGGCPKFWPRSAQKGPTLSKNGQKWPKYDFEHSGGLKRLEWHGTSYRTSWLRFWHNWGCVFAGGVPKCPKWPK